MSRALDALHAALAKRVPRPVAFVDVGEVPWADPDVGRRFLEVGRRGEADTEREVAFIISALGLQPGQSVLDVMCGDGRVALPLAQHGLNVTGTDINPIAVVRAHEAAVMMGLDSRARFACVDARQPPPADGHDAAIFIFGHLSGFARDDAITILKQARRGLQPGGSALIDMHLGPAFVRELDGQQNWSLHEGGWLGTDAPAMVLDEYFTDEATLTFVRRSYCVDLIAGDVTCFAQSGQFYDEAGMRALLHESGFELQRLIGDFDGQPYDDETAPNQIAIAVAT